MGMGGCIFCRIAKDELPSEKIYEDDEAVAFLDIMPAAEGHALVLPKGHYERLTDVPPEKLRAVMVAAKKVAAAVVKATGAEGFNLLQSNGEAAGQVVGHVHFHIIPRKKDDGLSFSWTGRKPAAGELEKTGKSVKAHM
jgi:histidine triad (HIT) family protein